MMTTTRTRPSPHAWGSVTLGLLALQCPCRLPHLRGSPSRLLGQWVNDSSSLCQAVGPNLETGHGDRLEWSGVLPFMTVVDSRVRIVALLAQQRPEAVVGIRSPSGWTSRGWD